MGLLKKGMKAYSMFNLKCPRCHEGKMFETGTFSFSKPFEMHARCPKCDLNYEPEPGYYYGAMYMSYMITGGFCLSFVGLLILGFDWSINGAFALLIVILTLLFVWIFRFARAIWINIYVNYDATYPKKQPVQK